MSRQDKTKISVEGANTPLQLGALAGLDGLDVSALPEGPADVKPIAPVSKPVPEGKKRGRVILRREKKDRGGKTVVVVSGFREIPGFRAAEVEDLSRALRKRLGCGGTVDSGEIVVQGDRPAAVTEYLESLGFTVAGVRQ